MGSFCCCPCVDELEEYTIPTFSLYRHCICLRFLFHQLFNGSGAVFHRLEGRSMPSSNQGATSLASSGIATALPDNSLNDSQLALSRSITYDSEQRYSRLQRDGLVSRRDKSMIHFQEDPQPPRRNMSSSGTESLGFGKKQNGVDYEEDSKLIHSESSEKAFATKLAYVNYLQTSAEDEDVCPTCLDEYTPENPKITTRCSHHFHLGCIYEWLERSESCPICGKEMEFCESP
ncbi:E3 ubiquitin-protein ligase At3g02290-like [Mangifera indica]|uniref:E3 ubiquitin-protein ligase At3g02290-like n=1 Tax=Mangifera indica TaxID=29780 RepID=UPI001CF96FED|nr:E3 ubiquitin-protein ligase At3g02290-like [Mangifera indica]XP_044512476.1 E3 ubiquitin-protein ligase At3g02290-like [Mangifera indica]XP_044512477.1 E3 ubiquitin-protein ligase At3g02290-like [Mangifera indica]XP_044512478.1 E3 ubiquitin-protein ligase At3g02290-like [Mangifera indica]XP_044512479.1 E3 ubiquitin-protein ligase At3g02290-like [Mangifera indica]